MDGWVGLPLALFLCVAIFWVSMLQSRRHQQQQASLQQLLLQLHEQNQRQSQLLEKEVREELKQGLARVDSQLLQQRQFGFEHFEKIQGYLHQVEKKWATLDQVGKSLGDLNQLLRLPHFRGHFGEWTLEKLLADFLPLGTYELQHRLDEDSQERVDAVIHLANQKKIPIDSKFPRESILPLYTSDNPADLEWGRKRLIQFIKSEAKTISEKYIRPDRGTLDMAFLFLPSEVLYFEVVREGELFEFLVRLKVFPVSPNTLAIALKSIALAQEYYHMAQGVEETLLKLKAAQRQWSLVEEKLDTLEHQLRKSEETFLALRKQWRLYEKEVGKSVREV